MDDKPDRGHTVEVHNGDIGTADDQSLAHDKAQTTGTSSDKTDIALEGEVGESALEMVSSTTLHRLTLWHILFFWVLHGDALGSREGTDMLADLALVRLILLALARSRGKGSEGRKACGASLDRGLSVGLSCPGSLSESLTVQHCAVQECQQSQAMPSSS